jgi:3-hydroxy-9,10-secoandrosta-1,3,5(10)-triene-9,17-dione monooxygenase
LTKFAVVITPISLKWLPAENAMHATQDVKTVAPTPAELIARVRALMAKLAARADKAEQDRRVPYETIADMQAAGLFRVFQPERWGGYQIDPATYFEIQLALAEGCMSTGWVYGVVGLHPWLMGLFDDRAAQEVWGDDNTTLICSSLMPTGTAVPAPGGFRLSGHWKFASGCEHCGWAYLGGTPAPDGGPGDRSIFLVPRSDYEIEDTWRVSGLKATGSHDIVVKDAFVPDYRRLRWIDNFNGVGPGQAVNKSSLYRWIFGQIFFRGVSTPALGALQGMLDAFLRYGRVRVARGARAVDDPSVQLVVAEVAAAIDEMKTVLFRNLDRLRDYAERGELPPLRDRTAYKFHSALVGERCSVLAARLFKAAGGAGLYTDLPFGRVLADITAGRQHISNQYEAIGRNLGAAMFGIEEQKDLML